MYLIDGSVEAAGGPNDLIFAWPPRSPDLSPIDIFGWEFIKKEFYNRKYKNMEDLKIYIYLLALKNITKNIFLSTMIDFEKCMEKVVFIKGGHAEV